MTIPNLLAAVSDPGDAGSAGITVDIGTEATKNNFFGYTCIGNLVSNIVSMAFIVASLAFFVFFVLGGIEWLTSGGDKVKVEGAQKRLTSALIGLTIVAASFAIYKVVLEFFGIDLSKLCTDTPLGS